MKLLNLHKYFLFFLAFLLSFHLSAQKNIDSQELLDKKNKNKTKVADALVDLANSQIVNDKQSAIEKAMELKIIFEKIEKEALLEDKRGELLVLFEKVNELSLKTIEKIAKEPKRLK